MSSVFTDGQSRPAPDPPPPASAHRIRRRSAGSAPRSAKPAAPRRAAPPNTWCRPRPAGWTPPCPPGPAHPGTAPASPAPGMAGTVSGGATGIALNSARLIGRAVRDRLAGHPQRQQHRPLDWIHQRAAPVADQPHILAVPQQHRIALIEHPAPIRQIGLPVDHRDRHRLRRPRAERLRHRITHQPRRAHAVRWRSSPSGHPECRPSPRAGASRSHCAAPAPGCPPPRRSAAPTPRFKAGYSVSPTLHIQRPGVLIGDDLRLARPNRPDG